MDDWYIYYGRDGEIVPEDVIRVKIHSSVRAIKARAFHRRGNLVTVTLNDGLEEIGEAAFYFCNTLREIDMPRSVKKIKMSAFVFCGGLTRVKLDEGLEEIEERAFFFCNTLREIVVPRYVKVINSGAFCFCSGLMRVKLDEGLEEIEERAFYDCTTLREIVVPRSVKVIKEKAFGFCRVLTRVKLDEGLEEIEARAFYNCESLREIAIPRSVRVIREGVFSCCQALTTVIPSNIPNRLGLVGERKWHANIQDMLRRIPSIPSEGWLSHFDSIHTKLSVYENLKDVPMLLELAIWKSRTTHHRDRNTAILAAEVRLQCRADSITMVSIVVPNVLSYLIDDDC